jgi:hypothetical protein
MTIAEKIKAAVKQRSDIVPYNNFTIGACQCADCPTHEQCKKTEKVFCSVGDSDNSGTITKQGCLCGECEVFKKFSLSNGYFCVNGEAK